MAKTHERRDLRVVAMSAATGIAAVSVLRDEELGDARIVCCDLVDAIASAEVYTQTIDSRSLTVVSEKNGTVDPLAARSLS